MIINNRHFATGMTDRSPSTDVDAINLNEVFTKRGFDVRQENDKTTAEMLEILSTGKGVFLRSGYLQNEHK